MLSTCQRAAKHFKHMQVTCIRIVKSASIQIPRSCMQLTRNSKSQPTASRSFSTMALYKFIYLLTYLLRWLTMLSGWHTPQYFGLLPSSLHSTEVGWTASSQRPPRHNQLCICVLFDSYRLQLGNHSHLRLQINHINCLYSLCLCTFFK